MLKPCLTPEGFCFSRKMIQVKSIVYMNPKLSI
jgi:hypothetical protein